jgi:hypothetical protein
MTICVVSFWLRPELALGQQATKYAAGGTGTDIATVPSIEVAWRTTVPSGFDPIRGGWPRGNVPHVIVTAPGLM